LHDLRRLCGLYGLSGLSGLSRLCVSRRQSRAAERRAQQIHQQAGRLSPHSPIQLHVLT
jgi:hypothetical protein